MHVICFDQPFPPTYGGAIDVFYRIKALHEAGIPLTLHIFLYHDRKPQKEMETLAERVFYYKRNLGIRQNLSLKPYIVESRNNAEMLENLCLDNEPILFEGLHTTFLLDNNRLRGRKKIVRMHNIEHSYFLALAKNKLFSLKSPYYIVESMKLRFYEKVLRHASLILPISTEDCKELKKRYPHNEVRLMDCFFDNTPTRKDDNSRIVSANYILYHGNLALAENIRAAKYIISHSEKIVPEGWKLVIAGRKPDKALFALAKWKGNIDILSNPSPEELENLLANAHINLLVTFQKTGVKLKLLNTLAKSYGFCIVNSNMLYGTPLKPLCHEANTPQEIRKTIEILAKKTIKEEEYFERQEKLKNFGFNDISPILSFISE